MKEHDLAKWMEGKMTGSELEAFEKSAEFESYHKIKQYSALLKGPDFDTEMMYQKLLQHPIEKAPIKLRPNYWMRIAAILVLAIGLFFLSRPMITVSETAQNGERKEFRLPDDSEVTLNAGSEVSYKKWNWDSQRRLHLEGEAFFKVTKGRTFDVVTDYGTVTVVGTRFNVKQRGQRLEVICYEGKVRVQDHAFSVLLTPGESVVYENNTGNEGITRETKPMWIGNRISFRSESFAAVLAEIERQYDIVISAENINTPQRFTGTIPTDNIDTALQIISSTYNFNYTKSGKNRIIFAGK